MNWQRITLQVAERLRDYATRQGNVPFLSGELRASHVVHPVGATEAVLSANTPYARPVHDGRPAITIRPSSKRALHWAGARHPVKSVTQPARQGDPWMMRAVESLEAEGLDFLAPEIGADLTRALRSQGVTVRRR